jgi:hypothetical protein
VGVKVREVESVGRKLCNRNISGYRVQGGGSDWEVSGITKRSSSGYIV